MSCRRSGSSSALTIKQKKKFLVLLDEKGLPAYSQFLECLDKETEHIGYAYIVSLLQGKNFGDEETAKISRTTHLELFKKITSEEDSTAFRLQQAEGDAVPVMKRVPDRIKAQGALVSEKYFKCISKMRRHHLEGSWAEADEIVKESYDIAFLIAVILENCTGHITHRNKETVLLEVGRAKRMCDIASLWKPTGALFCPQEKKFAAHVRESAAHVREWVLAKMYRYTREPDKALMHIQEHQAGIESGALITLQSCSVFLLL